MSDFNLVWSTPFLRTQTPDLALAEDLRDYILSCEHEDFQKPVSPQRPHTNVFESKFDFLNWPDERVQKFKNLLFGHLGGMVKMANDIDDAAVNRLRFDNHCWFHITRDGGYFQPHNHPNASWSAIYCVDPGDATPVNESAAGHVMFSDPRQANSYLDPANRNMRRDLSFNAVRLRMAPGEILMFPSYLYHYVEPYIGVRPRITIAANFWFALDA